MVRKLLPLILALIGLGGGLGAGILLRPGAVGSAAVPDPHVEPDSLAEVDAHVEPEAHAEPDAHTTPATDGHTADDPTLPDYIKLNNQFIVPVLEDGRVAAMVILSLSLEVNSGGGEAV